MDGHIEREYGALGGLFQHIIHDMKVCHLNILNVYIKRILQNSNTYRGSRGRLNITKRAHKFSPKLAQPHTKYFLRCTLTEIFTIHVRGWKCISVNRNTAFICYWIFLFFWFIQYIFMVINKRHYCGVK